MADRELDPSDRPAKRQRVSDDDAATTSNPGAACLSQTLSLVSDEAARRDLDDQLAKEIQQEQPNVKVMTMQLDVSDPQQVKDMAGGLKGEFKDVNILVNNA